MVDRLVRAELLSIGTELTIGETRDTNAGDLAAALSQLGVEVLRITALPDTLHVVQDAFRDALGRADLVVATGGLGPTPDDLTREAIAAACGVRPFVDPVLERDLRASFARRGIPMPDANLKQAWLVPGAVALANPNGTAPGWWLERPDGRVIVAMPGPPREMRPMWQAQALPRLRRRGIGADRTSETLRLTGLGESAVAALIGERPLRAANPQVATYVRPDGIDVRVSAVAADGRSAADLVATMVEELLARLEPYVFARGDGTWVEALGVRLAGRTVASVEVGTGGQLAALLGPAPWLVRGEVLSPAAAAPDDAVALARRAAATSGCPVGVCVVARERLGDTEATVAVVIDGSATEVSPTAFLAGEQGRLRAALLAAAELWRRLGDAAP